MFVRIRIAYCLGSESSATPTCGLHRGRCRPDDQPERLDDGGGSCSRPDSTPRAGSSRSRWRHCSGSISNSTRFKVVPCSRRPRPLRDQVLVGRSVGLYIHRWRYGTFEEVGAAAVTVGIVMISSAAANPLLGHHLPVTVPILAGPLALRHDDRRPFRLAGAPRAGDATVGRVERAGDRVRRRRRRRPGRPGDARRARPRRTCRSRCSTTTPTSATSG